MKILIFGGTGFIGSNLISELLENNNQVYIVTRNPQKISNIFRNKVHVIKWDSISNLTSQELQKIEVVINLAGESISKHRWSKSIKQEILSSRINITKEIVSAINNHIIQPELLINASAVGFYGFCQDDYMDESKEAGDDFLAKVSQDWENEAYKVKNNSTRVVTIRMGVVLGDEGALKRMIMPFKFFLGGPLGTGNQWLSWIHIKDLVRMISFIIDEKEIIGPVNLTAPEASTMRDFSKAIGEVLHKPSWFPVPEIILKMVLGQMADMLIYGQRVVPNKILNSGFDFEFPQLHSALKDIIKR